MSPSKFLISFFSAFVVLMTLIATINIVINPFDIFNIGRFDKINKIKPYISDRVRTTKLYQPFFNNINTLIIGNSRVEMGLNPQDFPKDIFANTYNLGLPGVGIVKQLQYADRVLAENDVQYIFLSLDFVDFLHRNPPAGRATTHAELKVNEITDKLAAIFSLDALIASLNTTLQQDKQYSNRMSNGFNPALDFLPVLKYEGEQVLFQQKIDALYKQIRQRTWYGEFQHLNPNSDYHVLQRFIEKHEKAQIFVFINGYHRDYYQVIDNLALTNAFEDWRQLLKNNIAENCHFYDFTELAKELSNVLDDNNNHQYFWEPAHYKQNFGKLMIDKMLEEHYAYNK
ncbi:hypothetical protein [Thalassotalea maritima]|uniref:hypothetical protein n=1 Tax=Thalassotalea maritima TaxID=3242416 RepID=UPI003529466C